MKLKFKFDKASVIALLKSAEKHIETTDKIMEGTCSDLLKLSSEFNRFEKSVIRFKEKNNLE